MTWVIQTWQHDMEYSDMTRWQLPDLTPWQSIEQSKWQSWRITKLNIINFVASWRLYNGAQFPWYKPPVNNLRNSSVKRSFLFTWCDCDVLGFASLYISVITRSFHIHAHLYIFTFTYHLITFFFSFGLTLFDFFFLNLLIFLFYLYYDQVNFKSQYITRKIPTENSNNINWKKKKLNTFHVHNSLNLLRFYITKTLICL